MARRLQTDLYMFSYKTNQNEAFTDKILECLSASVAQLHSDRGTSSTEDSALDTAMNVPVNGMNRTELLKMLVNY